MSALIRLCHHRWSIPVLAVLAPLRGGRYATLRHRLGIARETVRRAVAWLEDQNYVMPNPGYGHPLRPELLLTPWGEAVAGSCRAIWGLATVAGLDPDVILRKWSLPTLVAISLGEGRYSRLAESLPGISPRALSQTLQVLEAAGLVEHAAATETMHMRYVLTDAGRVLAEAGRELGESAGA